MGNNFGDLLRHAAAKLCGPAKRVYRLHFLKRSSQDSHTLDTPHNRANTPVRAPTVVFDPVTPVNLDVPLVFFFSYRSLKANAQPGFHSHSVESRRGFPCRRCPDSKRRFPSFLDCYSHALVCVWRDTVAGPGHTAVPLAVES